MRLNSVLAHSFLSVSKEGSFVWIAVEGGAICCAFQLENEGLTHTHDATKQGSSSENNVFFYP